MSGEGGSTARRVAVVTGGGRGIGRAIALRFASLGAAVVVSSRTATDLDDVVEEVVRLGGRGLAVRADATGAEGARAPVLAALAEFGRVEILVNNVGGSAGPDPDPLTTSDEAFMATVNLNLFSAWRASRAALPSMCEQHFGRIINIGSGDALHAGSSASYTAAKHGVVGLTRSMANTLGRHGVTVNCLCPGWTNTQRLDWERLAARWGVSVAAAKDRAAATNAQRRVLEPEELTGMAALLAGPDGSAITGQVIGVDGGYQL